MALMKVFTNFSQHILIIATFQLNWPDIFGGMEYVNNNILAAPLQAFSMDCYYRNFGFRTSLVTLLSYIVIPFVLMLIAVLVFYIIFILKEGAKINDDPEVRQRLKNSITVSCLVAIFVFHP